MTLSNRIDQKKSELTWERVLEDRYQEPTPALFAELAVQIGRPIREEFVEFVRGLGGSRVGDSDLGYVSVIGPEPNPWKAFGPDVFYGFYSGKHSYDLRHSYQTFRQRLPSGFVPFSRDGGGNQALYAAFGDHAGQVYFWDHEYGDFFTAHPDITAIYDELDEHGLETEFMDIADAILAWEKIHAAELSKPPGFGNMYLLATSLDDFVERMNLKLRE